MITGMHGIFFTPEAEEARSFVQEKLGFSHVDVGGGWLIFAAPKAEFAGRHNLRNEDTVDIMAAIATGMGGKRLRYTDLIADNGLESGARA